MTTDEKRIEASAEAEAEAANQITPASTASTSPSSSSQKPKRSIWRRVYEILTWTPPRCRWDPEKPPTFSLGLNILFAFAAGFTVANLYYNHPILNILVRIFACIIAYETYTATIDWISEMLCTISIVVLVMTFH
jgi:hypothetical protein